MCAVRDVSTAAELQKEISQLELEREQLVAKLAKLKDKVRNTICTASIIQQALPC